MPAPRETSHAPSATLEALRSSIGVLRWTLFALVLVYLASNVRIVGPNENALVLRLGRLTDRVHAPGLLVSFPYPIDEVLVVPTRAVQEIRIDDWAAAAPAIDPAAAPPDSPDAPLPGSPDPQAPPAPVNPTLHPVRDGYALTGDVNLVHLRFSVRYSVSDPRDYALNAIDRDGLLRKVLLDAACEAIQTLGVDDALTSGQDRLRLESQRVAQKRIDSLRLGIAIQAWELREITPARQVIKAFEEVVSAKVDAQTAIEKANAHRGARLPEMEAKAFRIRQEAEAEARRITERARGEAASFLAQFEAARLNPQAFRTQRQLEVIHWLIRRAWMPMINGGGGPPLQLLIRPPAHDPEPVPDE